MTTLRLHAHGDDCWPDLVDKTVLVGNLVGMARLPRGTSSGRSSVTIRVELPDGTVVLAQTTLALLNNAVLAFNAVEDD